MRIVTLGGIESLAEKSTICITKQRTGRSCDPRQSRCIIFSRKVFSQHPISEKLLVNTNKQYVPKDRDMPSIPMMYTFDPHTRVHTGSRPAQVVGGKALTQSSYATTMPPPASIPEGHVARWTGTAWETVEDHRQHMDSKGTKTGGTPYWLPAKGDDWQSPPRYTEALGPLPSGAVTVRPEKPLAVIKEEKKLDIRSACDVAIVASLTMPTASPSILTGRIPCWFCILPAVTSCLPLWMRRTAWRPCGPWT